MARASGPARLQCDSSDRPHLFPFNLFQGTRRHPFRDCDRATRLHAGRNNRRARIQPASPAVARISALANRESSAANRASSQILVSQLDFIHEFVPGISDRTLLLLHGTGGNEHDLIRLGRELDPNAALLRPETLAAAILFRVMVPLIPDNLPDLSSVRVWIGAGDQDPIVPASEAQRLVDLLRRAGADVTIRFANASHALTDADVKTARHWLKG